MALAAGTRLSSYEVLGSLGAGGMGEVYRAKDVRLGREVAIKLLSSAVLSEPDRPTPHRAGRNRRSWLSRTGARN